MLGDAINRLIKFSLKSLKEKISYAHLMCGEYGLVHALINIFSFGYDKLETGYNLPICLRGTAQTGQGNSPN